MRPFKSRVGALLLVYLQLSAGMSACEGNLGSVSVEADEPVSKTHQALPGDPIAGYARLPSESWNSNGAQQTSGVTPFSTSVSRDGLASATIPLAVPPGRGGTAPRISLTYSGSLADGPLGVGWRLGGLSSIARCNSTPANAGSYSETAGDSWCLDGVRLVPFATNKFRTLVDSESQIERTATGWTVTAPDGSVAEYNFGWPSTAQSQWLLTEQRDVFGNDIRYSYATDSLPSEIRYTGHRGLGKEPTRSVQFVYENRLNSRSGFAYGVPTALTRRLSRVQVFAPSGVASFVTDMSMTPLKVREYRLTYHSNLGVSMGSPLDVLAAVQECDANGVCLLPVVLESSIAPPDFGPQELLSESATGPIERLTTGDIDGDGDLDLLYRVSGTSRRWLLRRMAGGRGEGPEIDLGFSQAVGDAPDPVVFDIDADGRPELLGPAFVQSRGSWNFYRPYTVDLASTPPLSPKTIASVSAENMLTGRASFGDFDGDGTPDAFDVAHWQSGQNLNDLVFRRMQRSNSTFASAVALPARNCPPRQSTHPSTGRSINCTAGGVCNDCTSQDVLDIPGYAPALGLPLTIFHETTRSPKGVVTSEWRRNWVLEANVMVGDVDGNGRDDVLFRDALSQHNFGNPPVFVPPNFNTLHATRYSRWTGDGSAVVNHLLLNQPPTGSLAVGRSVFFLEFNGDGLPDIGYFSGGPSGVDLNVHQNRGLGQFEQTPVVIPAVFPDSNFLRVLDFDADGRVELYDFLAGKIKRLHSGTTFTGPKIPLDAVGVASGDVNNDGSPDMVYALGYSVFARHASQPPRGRLLSISQGRRRDHFEYAVAGPGSDVYVKNSDPCPEGQICRRAGMTLVRRHGVLQQDSVSEPTAKPVLTQFRYFDGRVDATGAGWLGFQRTVQRNLETGAVTEVEYGIAPTQAVSPVQATPGARVRRVYPYVGLPVRTTTCVDLRDGIAGRFLRTDTYSSSTMEWTQTQATPPEFVTSEASREVDLVESEGALAAGAPSPCTLDGVTGVAATPLRSSRISSVITRGVETSRVQSDWLGGFSGSAPRSVPSNPVGGVWSTTRTKALLAASASPWLRRLVEREETTSVSPEPSPTGGSATRRIDYEYQPGTSVVRKVTQEKNWPSVETPTTSGFTLELTLVRDGYGNVTRESALGSGQVREQNYAFDSYEHAFVVKQWVDPLGTGTNLQETFANVDRAFGVAVATDDLNGVRTTAQLDTFGRLRTSSTPGLAAERLSYDRNPHGQDLVTRTRGVQGAVSREEVAFDAFGRPVETVAWSISDVPSRVLMKYDVFGRRTHVSRPFVAGRTPEYISTTFDKAGRETGTFDSATLDQSTRMYLGLTVRSFDARGLPTSTVLDARRRVSSNSQHRANGVGGDPFTGTPVSVLTKYGPFDLPTEVIDADGLVRTLAYDALGRRTTLNDPDTGPRLSLYNAFGEPKRETDPRGTTVASSYDRLGRLETRTLATIGQASPGLVSNTDTFRYDTGVNGRGRLASTTSMDGITTEHQYTILGQPHIVTRVVPGRGSFSITNIYDSEGRMSGIRYPDSTGVAYTFNANGTARAAYAVGQSGLTLAMLYAVTSRSAAGQVVSETFGNQVTTNRVLDRAERVAYEVTEQPSLLQSGANVFRRTKYNYGRGGVLEQRHELPTSDAPMNHTSEYYEYDDLARLKTWRVRSATGTCSEFLTRYSYSIGGRLEGRAVQNHAGIAQPAWSSTLGYGALNQAQPNAPRAMTEGTSQPTSFTYDAAGALSEVFRNRPAGASGTGDRRLAWTHFDLPRSIVDSGTTTTFSYDATGSRVLKSSGSAWTMTIGGLYEDRSVGSGRITSRTVYFEGRPVAVIDNALLHTTTRYVHTDRLGSSATITDSSGGIARLSDRVRYDPFGERRNPNALSTPASLNHSLPSATFTGHESDDEFALTNMRGRIYDPRVGRFLSPDPILATSTAQGLDRFSYVRNDPINSVDPSGFVIEPITLSAVATAAVTAVAKVIEFVVGLVVTVAPYVAVAAFVGYGIYLIIQAVERANAAYRALTGIAAGAANATAEPLKLADSGVSADAGSSPTNAQVQDWADATGGRRFDSTAYGLWKFSERSMSSPDRPRASAAFRRLAADPELGPEFRDLATRKPVTIELDAPLKPGVNGKFDFETNTLKLRTASEHSGSSEYFQLSRPLFPEQRFLHTGFEPSIWHEAAHGVFPRDPSKAILWESKAIERYKESLPLGPLDDKTDWTAVPPYIHAP